MIFNKYRLEDITDKIGDGIHGTPEYDDNGDFYFVNGNNLVYGDIVFKNDTKRINEEQYLKNKRNLNKNTLLVSINGTLGNVAKYNNEKIILGKSACYINVKDEYNVDYVYFVFESPKFKKYLQYGANGTTIKNVPLSAIRNYEISIPSKENQDKIVKILKSIEDKIKLNNKINNNLHELMKIKFNNCIDNLEEYEESVLSKIANYKNGLAMQKFRPIDESGLPVIKIKEMNSGITSETERCRSDIDSDVIIDNGDILFAWSGTLCMNIWCGGRAGLNQHIFKVTSDKYPKWFYYFWTLKHLDNFIEIAAGKATTMGHIKRTELDKAIVKIPNEKIMEKMDKIFTPMLNKYVNNSIESKSLSELRYTLLPKLMNGEIDLDNIEI